MANREGLSKKIRFEVFKRDRFTCQYCGAKSPEVVLNIDHIDPVANGGTNEICNLITSCFSCNSGKGKRTLSDSSVVEKQRKQLELLQERREQIELMLEWKKSLSNLDNDVVEMVSEYINSKIQPLSINENGKQSVAKWLKKYKSEEVLDAIDISAAQYLKYGNGDIFEKSVELFLNKIGGILVVKNLSPIKQKIAYIKGIAKNRLCYWDNKKGSLILDNYIKEIEKHYNEQEILSDLEDEVSRITKEANNWTEWKNTIEKWTLDMQSWEIPEQKEIVETRTQNEYTFDDLERFVCYGSYEQDDTIKALEHIAKIFPKFSSIEFRQTLNKFLIDFLENHNDLENGKTDDKEARDFVNEYVLQCEELLDFFIFSDENNGDNIGVLMVLESFIIELLIDIFMSCYYPTRSMRNEYLKTMIEINIKELENNIA
jgi:hypothetical protein